MNYQSTRDSSVSISSAQAITDGISADGGLYVPTEFPVLPFEEYQRLAQCSYVERAQAVLQYFLTDYTPEEIAQSVENAYSGTFDHDCPAPLTKLSDGVYILELWHGPTCAFKDLALQLLPQLLTRAAKKTVPGKELVILVATSGDTGKAAMAGFADVEGTKILVFYPQDGVSDMQKLQMITQEGDNVAVCAVQGNFDDAQNGVKRIFTDETLKQLLAQKNMQFSSANSINWGRLVPQIVYYVSSYCDLLARGQLQRGDKYHVVVPTGNFGNILAAYYARKMGVPIDKLVCASNSNDVLTEFIHTGVYNRNRKFYTTTSPSMDILISSNLERLLYDLCDRDDEKVKGWMQDLAQTGRYEVDKDTLAKIQELFYAGSCNEKETDWTIKTTYENLGYLLDPHTAVAVAVSNQFVVEVVDDNPIMIVSTASPFKFVHSVLSALTKSKSGENEFVMAEELSERTGEAIPEPIRTLEGKTPRFDEVCTAEDMAEVVKKMLQL